MEITATSLCCLMTAVWCLWAALVLSLATQEQKEGVGPE